MLWSARVRTSLSLPPPNFTRCSATALTISGDCVWVVGTNETLAFNLALQNVAEDFYKVLGLTPVVVTTPPAAGAVAPNTTVIFFGSTQPWLKALAPAACYAGWETHCVVALPTTTYGYAAVVATGTGKRGAIFGAYTFSEKVLGVNPWWIINDDPPVYVGPSLTIPDTFSVLVPTPFYKYRAPFTNDEDLLGGFRRSPTGGAVFDEKTWDDQFQTGLRLKVNMWLVGTVPNPDEFSVSLASRRGLIVIHHHFSEWSGEGLCII